MRNNSITILFFIFFCFAFYGGVDDLIQYPDYFPDTEYNFGKNPISQSKINLGRALFYDAILSRDTSISCSSCHSPYNGFAHSDHDLSHGIDDIIGRRNAPALFNLAWQESFMWDGAINHLDMQALAPISHPGEMDDSLINVVHKLNESNIYPPLFQAAFGDSLATGERILKALSQFQLTLVSANSKYDKVKSKEEEFTEKEKKGYEIFKTHCNSCHAEPLFSTYDFANNGLDIDTTLNDFGKWNITQLKSDSLLFKIPSLRNLSYTTPYMHDGRFRKLSQVINHYTNDLDEKELIAKELKNPIELNSEEKIELISFLKTLNDTEFIFNPENKFPKEILLFKE